MSEEQKRSPFSLFAERLLVGTLEAGARAIARAGESLASDAKKALRNEALKVELLENGIKWWAKENLGEVDDLPESLRDDSPKGAA